MSIGRSTGLPVAVPASVAGVEVTSGQASRLGDEHDEHDEHTARMLHLRVVTPPDRTDAVVRTLGATPGATNVVRLRGAGVDPPGDLVQADIAREAADELLAGLRDLGVAADCAVMLEAVDTAFGREVDRARRDAPGEGADALVWEQLSETTQEDSTLSGAFLVFLVAATLVAAVGLLTDSTVLIVGAMALGPEFGPLAGLAVAVVQRRWRPALSSLRALAVGFPVAIAGAAVMVALLEAAGLVPVEYLQGRRPLTSFVSHPDAFSVLVALVAGIAGTVSLTSSKASTLVGVVISVTTVPAAANIAAAAVTGHGAEAGGAAVQLVVNLVCIVVAAAATLAVQQWAQRRRVHAPA